MVGAKRHCISRFVYLLWIPLSSLRKPRISRKKTHSKSWCKILFTWWKQTSSHPTSIDIRRVAANKIDADSLSFTKRKHINPTWKKLSCALHSCTLVVTSLFLSIILFLETFSDVLKYLKRPVCRWITKCISLAQSAYGSIFKLSIRQGRQGVKKMRFLNSSSHCCCVERRSQIRAGIMENTCIWKIGIISHPRSSG